MDRPACAARWRLAWHSRGRRSIASPLLEASIDGAHGVLLSIQGGSDLGLFEINEAARLVQEVAHPEANIIFGAVIDDALGDEARVTVIAAGFDQVDATSRPAQPLQNQAPARSVGSAAPAARTAPPVPGTVPGTIPIGGPGAARNAGSQDTAPQQRMDHSRRRHEYEEQQDIPDIVESDYTGGRNDDLDVPDFLK